MPHKYVVKSTAPILPEETDDKVPNGPKKTKDKVLKGLEEKKEKVTNSLERTNDKVPNNLEEIKNTVPREPDETIEKVPKNSKMTNDKVSNRPEESNNKVTNGLEEMEDKEFNGHPEETKDKVPNGPEQTKDEVLNGLKEKKEKVTNGLERAEDKVPNGFKNIYEKSPLDLTKANGEEKVVIRTPNNGVGKILIREDTVLANFPGCAGCGRGQFTCTGVKKQWSVLCWGKLSDRKYYFLLGLLIAVFVLSLIGTVFFCFTNTINDVILSNMIIRNNSLAFSVWRKPNVQPLMKVRLFNYSNWEAVARGDDEKLRVTEMGPYVYSQQLERVDIKFDGDQLSYKERTQFEYLPEKSVGAHFDQVFVPNLPLLGMVSRPKPKSLDNFFGKLFEAPINSIVRSFNDHPDAFVELSVHRFLWGYDDNLVNMAKTLFLYKYDKFGLLVSKNLTESEQYTINTGEHDMNKMNLIEKVDGESHLRFWNYPECNRIDASDGTIFPPSMLDKNKTLYVFYSNLCRRLPFIFKEEVKINDGIVLHRYKMPENVFDDPEHNPDNQCYCDAKCPPRGVINVTACTMGAPAMISFPHFFRGDPKLRRDIEGLVPNPQLHDTHIDIHPTLGISLQGRSSFQINIQVKKVTDDNAVRFLPEGLILPVAWIEMSVEELPESLKSLVYHGTYSTAALQLGLSVMCVIALIVSSTCLAVMLLQKRQKPCATIKKVEIEVVDGKSES